MKMKKERLIYAVFPERGVGVILNGIMIYRDTYSGDGYQVAHNLSIATGLPVEQINLTWDDVDKAAL
jgi:hypothetical protein